MPEGTFFPMQRAPEEPWKRDVVCVDPDQPQGVITNIFCLSGRTVAPESHLPKTLSSREISFPSLLV